MDSISYPIFVVAAVLVVIVGVYAGSKVFGKVKSIFVWGIVLAVALAICGVLAYYAWQQGWIA
ncbi:Uncharacterised protein [Candidatus Gugararchaeum adminiculabundum]|nr:Uncharacterised protein [Candidatus Gugararchaeum adminiculabundum]